MHERDRDATNKIREKTRKWTERLFDKADELWKLCSVFTAVITYGPVRRIFKTFQSSSNPDWPPPMKEIVSTLIVVGKYTNCWKNCAVPAAIHQLSDNLPIRSKKAMDRADSVDGSGLGSALDYDEVVIQHDSVQEPCECEAEVTAIAFTPFDMQGQDNVGGGVPEQEGNK